MFEWIRKKAFAAVLAGINDAAAYLESQGGAEMEQAQRQLEERLRPALPAPAEEESPRRKRA